MKDVEANISTIYKYVKARKNYFCSKCGHSLPKGTIHLHASGRFLGFWRNDRYCRNCDLDIINSLIEKIKTPLLKRRSEIATEDENEEA